MTSSVQHLAAAGRCVLFLKQKAVRLNHAQQQEHQLPYQDLRSVYLFIYILIYLSELLIGVCHLKDRELRL